MAGDAVVREREPPVDGGAGDLEGHGRHSAIGNIDRCDMTASYAAVIENEQRHHVNAGLETAGEDGRTCADGRATLANLWQRLHDSQLISGRLIGAGSSRCDFYPSGVASDGEHNVSGFT